MSGYIRREDRLFDPTTGALVGYIDANGNEQVGYPVSGYGKDKTAIPDASGWILLTMLAGFTSSNAAVRQNGNRFEFRGRVNGAITEGAAIAKMPAALSVANDAATLAAAAASTGTYVSKVGIDGTISATVVTGSPTWVQLDGLVVSVPARTVNVNAAAVSNLPIFRMDTGGAALPDPALKLYIPATVSIEPNGSQMAALAPTVVEVSGHGNSTWGLPKKSAKVKFGTATEVLGMPADKAWRLLANHYDETLIRNAFCFDMIRPIYDTWTPRYEFCEFYLNGVYQGLYQMTEPVKASAVRLPVSIFKSSSTGLAATGAFIVEVNERLEAEGNNGFRSATSNVPISWDDPEPPTASQITYITSWMNTFDSTLMGGSWLDPVNGYAKLVDMNSWADWYLVSELSRNQDSVFYSSVKMYKTVDTTGAPGKLYLGPLWDSDLSLGNGYNTTALTIRDFSGDPTLWHTRPAVWINRMMTDPDFIAVLQTRWARLKAALYGSTGVIQSGRANAQKVAVAAQSNARRWGLSGDSIARFEMALNWLQRRIEWLDVRIANPTITNLATNPRAVNATTNYAALQGNGTATMAQAAGNPLGGSSARTTWSVATTTQAGMYYVQQLLAQGVNPGATITVTVALRASKNQNLVVGMDQKNAGGGLVSSSSVPATIIANELLYVTTQYTIAALVTQGFFFAYPTGGGVWGIGDWIEMCGIIIIKGAQSQLTFADGASGNWLWNGAAFASTSTGWNL